MSVKRPITSSCKLCSIYKEKLEDFLIEIEVDTYFFHNIFDISQSSIEKYVWTKVPTRFFCYQVVPIMRYETLQLFILQEEVKITKRELSCFLDSLLDFLKALDQASKFIHPPLRKLKVDIVLTKLKDNPFTHFYKNIFQRSYIFLRPTWFILPIWKPQIFCLCPQKVSNTRQSIFTYRIGQP